MLNNLIHRPIGVLLSFTALAIFSLLSLHRLPVSLLPDTDTPVLYVRSNYPNASPYELEGNIMAGLRERLLPLNRLKDVRSEAHAGHGTIRLLFEQGTRMDMAFIEANEIVDRQMEHLPRDMDRPQVIRINTTDVPLVRINIVPGNQSEYGAVSTLTKKVIKKRLEQLEGVSMVDINGTREQVIEVRPYTQKLNAFGVTEQGLISAIMAGNLKPGNVQVKDGHYRYFLKVEAELRGKEGIKNMAVSSPSGHTLKLNQLAEVLLTGAEAEGIHLFNGSEGLVVNVHKQASAQMALVAGRIKKEVEGLRKDFPHVGFHLIRDQSILLSMSLGNLTNSLVYGCFFAFLVLFVFMGNVRLPLIMGISLPVSVIISFLFFYFTGLSVNVISLSGLALGIGMLIDNAIIVIDNISTYKNKGESLWASASKGTTEVMSALISSALTTLAVFVPLVFLNGLAGALFYDQAVAVAIILLVSLAVSFILIPVVYVLFFQRYDLPERPVRTDSRVFHFTLRAYHQVYNRVFRLKGWFLAAIFIISVFILWNSVFMPRSGMPEVENRELEVAITWNEAITVEENKRRAIEVSSQASHLADLWEADVGQTQYILKSTGHTTGTGTLYFKFGEKSKMDMGRDNLTQYLAAKYPQAVTKIIPAPNAFEQVFARPDPFYELRIRRYDGQLIADTSLIESLASLTGGRSLNKGSGFERETEILLEVDHDLALTYHVPVRKIITSLNRLFANYLITEIKQFGDRIPVLLKKGHKNINSALNSTLIRNENGEGYPLSQFVKAGTTTGFKTLHADQSGLYQSLTSSLPLSKDEQQSTGRWALENNLKIDFAGYYFTDRENLSQLFVILIVSVLLLYFILAAQFESFLQPLIVLLTLLPGISGALIVLQLTGQTINIMSAIGMVIMLGIIVNDSILKIDTYNRMLAERVKNGTVLTKELLMSVLKETGNIRLKPVLMTTITTVLALLPVALSSGLGADLQRPLAYAVMGGLLAGTLCAVFVIPLLYWYIKHRAIKAD
ncbi:MAG: efflux RND transporter permease subunit [Cyclobacteriaceae bacterium]|nr:efflux RND transporter permease subunit [Cyclobacteriaceae bacterium]